METFQPYCPCEGGIHRSQVDSPHKGPVTRSCGAFFHIRLDQRLNNQTVIWTSWRSCDVSVMGCCTADIAHKGVHAYIKRNGVQPLWKWPTWSRAISLPFGTWIMRKKCLLESLTRCLLLTRKGVIELTYHWCRQWLGAMWRQAIAYINDNLSSIKTLKKMNDIHENVMRNCVCSSSKCFCLFLVLKG